MSTNIIDRDAQTIVAMAAAYILVSHNDTRCVSTV